MFAVDVCRLPATGGSTLVLVAGLFLLAAGAIVTRWVRQSAGRLSVVVAPLVLLGGLALTPQVTDPCMPLMTVAPTTTTAPDATASPTTTATPDATASPTTTTSPTTTAVPEPVFSNDDVVHAYNMSTAETGTWTGDTSGATMEINEPYFDDDSGSDSGNYSVWFKWVATTNGSLVIDSCDTSFDSVLRVYSISNILDPWNNDVFIAEDDSSAPDSCGGDDPARIMVAVSAGNTYYIQLDGYEEDDFGPAQLNWQFIDSNDDVVDAFELTGSGSWTGDTTLATVEVGEPGSDDGAYATVWFKWVATTTGSLVVDSCDTQFNSYLMARSISNIQDPWSGDVLIEEDGNSAECDAINSAQITVSVSAGSTYYIQLGGDSDGSSGPAQLNWQFSASGEPTNDDVVDAFELTGSGSWTGNTSGVTMEINEPYFDDDIDSDSGNYSVWFKWVATTNGSLGVDSCDTSFDSVLRVYSISNILDPWNNDVFIAEDDSSAPDSCGGDDPARITGPVSAGSTYYIQLDGYDAEFGPAQLNWTFSIPYYP